MAKENRPTACIKAHNIERAIGDLVPFSPFLSFRFQITQITFKKTFIYKCHFGLKLSPKFSRKLDRARLDLLMMLIILRILYENCT